VLYYSRSLAVALHQGWACIRADLEKSWRNLVVQPDVEGIAEFLDDVAPIHLAGSSTKCPK